MRTSLRRFACTIDRIYQQSSTAMRTSLRRFACTIDRIYQQSSTAMRTSLRRFACTIDRIYQQSSTAMRTSLRRFACTIAWLVVACAVFAAGTIFGAMLRLSPGPQLYMRTQFQQPLGQN
jgi:hypothetical protein